MVSLPNGTIRAQSDCLDQSCARLGRGPLRTRSPPPPRPRPPSTRGGGDGRETAVGGGEDGRAAGAAAGVEDGPRLAPPPPPPRGGLAEGVPPTRPCQPPPDRPSPPRAPSRPPPRGVLVAVGVRAGAPRRASPPRRPPSPRVRSPRSNRSLIWPDPTTGAGERGAGEVMARGVEAGVSLPRGRSAPPRRWPSPLGPPRADGSPLRLPCQFPLPRRGSVGMDALSVREGPRPSVRGPSPPRRVRSPGLQARSRSSVRRAESWPLRFPSLQLRSRPPSRPSPRPRSSRRQFPSRPPRS